MLEYFNTYIKYKIPYNLGIIHYILVHYIYYS